MYFKFYFFKNKNKCTTFDYLIGYSKITMRYFYVILYLYLIYKTKKNIYEIYIIFNNKNYIIFQYFLFKK